MLEQEPNTKYTDYMTNRPSCHGQKDPDGVKERKKRGDKRFPCSIRKSLKFRTIRVRQ